MPAVDLPIEFYRWFWRGLIVAFLVVETLAILDPKAGDTLTENVRPLFEAHPLLWFVSLGAGAWLIVHFWFPAIERALLEIVT